MRAAVAAAIAFLLLIMPVYAAPVVETVPAGPVVEAVPRTYSAYGTFEATPCEECPNFENYEYPFLFSSVDVDGRAATYSMAASREGRREPVDGATLFVQIYDSNWEVIGRCRLYTDESGTGTLNYSDYMRGSKNCTNGCVARASFCCGNPVALKCTISNCLGEELGDYSGYPPSYPPCRGYEEGAWPSYAAVGGEEYAIMPASTDALIPAEQETLPLTLGFSLCFPLTVIFGLLAAAMYASGRDPFAMFSFYTPRYTRGYERPMGARGFTLSGSGLLSVVSGIVKASTGGGGEGEGEKVGKGNKAVQGAGATAAVKGQPGVKMAAGTGERPRAAAQPAAVREGPQGRPGAEGTPRRGGEAPRPEGRPSSAQTAAERAAEARMGGPIGMMVRAMFGDKDALEALKQMFREFRPDVASGATGEKPYFGMGVGEFALQLTSTLFCYSALPIFLTNLISQGFALATKPLEGARNLENMDHDMEMIRTMRENPDGTVTVTYTDVYGEKSTETFDKGSSRFSNFMTGMVQRYQSAQEFNNAATQDSNSGLANSSHDALSEDESRGTVVSELVGDRGMDKELEAIWLSPNAENLGAALSSHLTPEISENISVILTNKKADGTFVTADERAAAITFVQNNREALGAALSALVLFSNRGGDIAAVKDSTAVSTLLGLAGNTDAMGALLTGADGKIDIASFNSLTVLAATLRANEDGKMSELGGRVEMLLTNAADGARQNAEERARLDTSINPSEIFSVGSETERRVAQLGIGELMHNMEFYITGEGGSANGRFADMSYYVGSPHGSILGTASDLSGDSLDQFNAALGRYEGLAGMASALNAGLAAPPEGAEGAGAVFGTASAWLGQRGIALETGGHLDTLGPIINMISNEGTYGNPEFRDMMAGGGRDGKDAANELWDAVVSRPEDLTKRQEILDTIRNPEAKLEEIASAEDYMRPGMRMALAALADQSSSMAELRDAVGAMLGGDTSRMDESQLQEARDGLLRNFDVSMASTREDAVRAATIAMNPIIERDVHGTGSMNDEGAAAIGAIGLEYTRRNPDATLEALGAVADAVLPGTRDSLATIATQSSSEEDIRQALAQVTSTDTTNLSAQQIAELRDSTLASFDIRITSSEEEAARQATIAMNPVVERAAAETPPAQYTDAVEVARNLFSFDGKIDKQEKQVLDVLSNPSSSAMDFKQAMDYTSDRFFADTTTKEQRDYYSTLTSRSASDEERERAAQALAEMARIDSNVLQQLSQALPPEHTFMDDARRTAEGYFNGPLGRDAMQDQQQTLDQFGILNPQLATFKAETAELNPESQRIEDREEGERRAAERGGFGAEWQAAESALAAKRAEEERRRRQQGGGES